MRLLFESLKIYSHTGIYCLLSIIMNVTEFEENYIYRILYRAIKYVYETYFCYAKNDSFIFIKLNNCLCNSFRRNRIDFTHINNIIFQCLLFIACVSNTLKLFHEHIFGFGSLRRNTIFIYALIVLYAIICHAIFSKFSQNIWSKF